MFPQIPMPPRAPNCGKTNLITTFHSFQRKSFWPRNIIMIYHGLLFPVLDHQMWWGVSKASNSNRSQTEFDSWNNSRGGFSGLGKATRDWPLPGPASCLPHSPIDRAQPTWTSLEQQTFSFTLFLGFTLTFMFIYCSVEIGTALWQLVRLYCPGGKTNKLWVIHFWTSIWSRAFEPWSIPGLPGAA